MYKNYVDAIGFNIVKKLDLRQQGWSALPKGQTVITGTWTEDLMIESPWSYPLIHECFFFPVSFTSIIIIIWFFICLLSSQKSKLECRNMLLETELNQLFCV